MLIGSNDPDGRPGEARAGGVLIGSSPGGEVPGEDFPPEAPSPAGTGTHPEPHRPNFARRRLVLAAVAIVVIAGLIAALIVSQLRIADQNAVSSARQSGLAAARAFSLDVASYDYRHLTQDFGVVEQHSTASFKSTWAQSSQALVPVLTKYHATSVARVVAAGLESATSSQVVAVVFVNQTVVNDTQKQPTTDQSRLEMTLVRQGGHWLISKLTLL